jgi:hypothetical protein
MLNIEITLNALSLLCITVGALLAGYLFRSHQIKKKQFKISELRKEIIGNHSYILELQKEYVTLESSMKGERAPVLPLNPVVEIQKTAEAGR